MSALQVRQTEAMADWSMIREQAAILLKTGFLPQSIKTPEQAMAIILTGRELGIGTMAALNTINVIQGKPTVSPQLMLALINRSGQLEDMSIEQQADGCACTMKRKDRKAHTEYFGHKEAAAMGLLSRDNYKKQSGVMFRWRAVAACARIVFPDIILGFYTPDEMGAPTNEDGEIEETQMDHAPASTPALELVRDASPANQDESVDPADAGMIEELKSLNARLEFSDKQLRDWLIKKFSLNTDLSLPVALESLTNAELSQAIDIFKNRLDTQKKGGGGHA